MRYSFFNVFISCVALFNATACTSVSSGTASTETDLDADTAMPKYLESSTLPPSYPQNTDVWDVENVDVSNVNPARKLVALTFDDAPASKLENLISVFASFNEQNPDCVASATLFCNGRRCDNSTLHALTSTYALGWELGNHSYSHADFTTLTPTEIEEEIRDTEKLLYKIDGQEKHLFRPPFGKLREDSKSQINVPIIYWCVDTLDWTGRTSSQIEETVLSEIYDGAIILMHDGYEQTVQAVKNLLPVLKEKGYQAVSVSQMAKAHDCALKNGGAYIRARKSKALR